MVSSRRTSLLGMGFGRDRNSVNAYSLAALVPQVGTVCNQTQAIRLKGVAEPHVGSFLRLC